MTRGWHARNLFLRRALLGWCGAALLAREARADDGYDAEEDLRNLKLLDITDDGHRLTLVLPRYLEPTQQIPLVVLLHGLGETGDPRAGAYAWVERYGLGNSWQRLKRPPITRTSTRGEWTDARLGEVNDQLAARPFRGFAMVCPHMPNPKSAGEVDAYAQWIGGGLLSRVRKEAAQIATDAERTYLCGVSLGGYVSLEVLSRVPQAFGAWAGVQTAIGTFAAPGYAEKIAKGFGEKRPLYLLTSSQDHWRTSSEALLAAFQAKKLKVDYRVVPGPHDQPWLREAGTIEALLWLDRVRSP